MITEMNNKKVNLYNALESLYKKFMQESKSKFEKYSDLMNVNQISNLNIENSKRRLKRLRQWVKQINLKEQQLNKEFEQKNIQIEIEKENISKSYLELKNKILKFRNDQKSQLNSFIN